MKPTVRISFGPDPSVVELETKKIASSCGLLYRDVGPFLRGEYTVASEVSDDIIALFLEYLNGKPIVVDRTNYSSLKTLCEEFDCENLQKQVNAFIAYKNHAKHKKHKLMNQMEQDKSEYMSELKVQEEKIARLEESILKLQEDNARKAAEELRLKAVNETMLAEHAREIEKLKQANQQQEENALKVQKEIFNQQIMFYKAYVIVDGKAYWTDLVSQGTVIQIPADKGQLLAVQFHYKGQGRLLMRGHVECVGWMPWVASGEVCGTVDHEHKRLEAIEFKLDGADASLFTFSAETLPHGKDWCKVGFGATCGTTGQSKKLTALRIAMQLV